MTKIVKGLSTGICRQVVCRLRLQHGKDNTFWNVFHIYRSELDLLRNKVHLKLREWFLLYILESLFFPLLPKNVISVNIWRPNYFVRACVCVCVCVRPHTHSIISYVLCGYETRLRVFWKKKEIMGNWKTCIISSLIIGSHSFILILSHDCYLLLPTTALLSIWTVGQVGYVSMINEPIVVSRHTDSVLLRWWLWRIGCVTHVVYMLEMRNFTKFWSENQKGRDH